LSTLKPPGGRPFLAVSVGTKVVRGASRTMVFGPVGQTLKILEKGI
jgi:hypothetical protein